MTTRYLESYLVGPKGIRNLGKDSYVVLLALLDANPEATFEADVDFTNSIVAFADQEPNIWAKKNGEYLMTDSETENIRAAKLEQIAEKLGMTVAKVDSLITRIYSALVRQMRKDRDFSDAIENTRAKIETIIEEVEAEA